MGYYAKRQLLISPSPGIHKIYLSIIIIVIFFVGLSVKRISHLHCVVPKTKIQNSKIAFGKSIFCSQSCIIKMDRQRVKLKIKNIIDCSLRYLKF